MTLAKTSFIEKALNVNETDKKYGVGKEDLVFYLKKKTNWMMRPRESRTFNGQVINMRYSEMFDHPFVYHQTTNVSEDKIPINGVNWHNKKLIVPKTQPCLQRFLLHSKFNEANGGSEFYLYSRKEEISKSMAKYTEKAKAMGYITKAKKGELVDIARVLFPKINLTEENSVDEVNLPFYKAMDSDPEKIIEAFEDERIELKSAVRFAIKAGDIILKNGEYKWKGTSALIHAVPVGVDEFSSFVKYLSTEKGTEVAEKLLSEMKPE